MRKAKRTAALAVFALAALAAPAARAAEAPGIATGPNTPGPEGQVRLLGYVDPHEAPVTACRFEYGTQAGVYDHQAPCANHPGNEVQRLMVIAASGTYKLSFEGQSTPDLPFDATAGAIETALRALPAIGPGGVAVTPEGSNPTLRAYRFEFQGALADTDVAELGPAAGAVPLGGVSKPEALPETVTDGGLTGPREVTAQLEGLPASTTYHYRLFAENALGPASSAEGIFATSAEPDAGPCPNAGALGAARLPACRAWEMVSPPDKNGGEVMPVSFFTQVSADGSAVAFGSLAAFGDAAAASMPNTYMSLRTPSGWATHSLMPAQPPSSNVGILSGMVPYYRGDFSPDLDAGVFYAIAPLDETDPNVSKVVNLYLRDDLRSPGAGRYTLLTGCPLCAGPGGKELPVSQITDLPDMVAATPDFKHVFFESVFNLVAPAAGTKKKLYEWDEGTLRLAGILPDGKAAPESKAAIEGRLARHTISADGSRVFFSDGTDLYMRVQGETTVKLSAPETGVLEKSGGARFGDASRDGSRIFFEVGGDLYLYDANKPASDPHNLTLIYGAGSSGGVIGADADGETVYFVGRAFGGSAIFAWHDGTMRFLSSYGIANASIASDGQNSPVRVTEAGHLLFPTAIPIGPTGRGQGRCPTVRGGCNEFYLYNPQSDALHCVTCPPDGRMPVVGGGVLTEGSSGIYTSRREGGALRTFHFSTPVSADGRRVFFGIEEALLPEDTNGVQDVYEFDAGTGQLSLISSGTDPEPSHFLEASADGSNALFVTGEQISAHDTDTSYDLYDARIGGGLPEPLPRPAECEGESCRPAAPSSPPPPGTASSNLAGPGNPTAKPPRSCPKGKRAVKRKGKRRCVRIKHRRQTRHHAQQGGSR